MSSRSALIVLVALTLLALLSAQLAAPWWRARRRRRVAARPLPMAWRTIMRRNVLVYEAMPPALQRRVDELVSVFLAEKRFVGCGGLDVSEEMRVTIATQACVLIAAHDNGCFDSTRAVLVYPRAFKVQREGEDDDGLVHSGRDILAGESWELGEVIVSWDDALHGGRQTADGVNVVMHEFAHQLDGEDGGVNGAPALGDPARYAAWAETMKREYEALRLAAQRDDYDGVLDPYGASDPAEFFAVATETFFERPQALRQAHAELYARLSDYYAQDPASWPAAAHAGPDRAHGADPR